MKLKLSELLKRELKNRGVILMYHHIANVRCDPWQLAVSPENFEKQLFDLKQNFSVVSLDEMILSLKKISQRKKMVAITFDDGFRDNREIAASLLETYKLPATFYVSTKLIGSDDMFWWDMLEHLILHSPILPSTLTIAISGKLFQYELHEVAVLTERLSNEVSVWNFELPIPNKRVELYFKIWEQLKILSVPERDVIIANLKAWAGENYPNPGAAGVMNVSQLQTLSKNSLFTIGAHTVSHPALAAQSIENQEFEIGESKKALEGWLGEGIDSFAYPYGNYSDTTIKLLRENGFQHAVTTAEKTVVRSSNVFELPRYQVKNWDGKEFHKKVSEWFLN